MSEEYVEFAREPLRPVVDTPELLDECLASLAAGTGPVAFDAERAHGHRYWPKAYLFQIRRAGSGTWLIDPIAFEVDGVTDLSALVEATGDATWLIHAASQDLPCMRSDAIRPPAIFDTELAGRLLGEPGVSLAALLESKLGVKLRKAHSADNWATRPLPDSWLDYAALDVDYLPELADVIREDLERAGRTEWAEQEFAATLEQFRVEPPPPAEPWRRLSGVTDLRHPRQLAFARALWEERDQIARTTDRPPGRILSDQAIVALASHARPDAPPPPPKLMDTIPGFKFRGAQRYRTNWTRALVAAESLDPKRYPARRPHGTGLPLPRNWERTNPEAAVRWDAVKPAVDALAESLGIQASLVAPKTVIQGVIYEFDATIPTAVQLAARGARPWQVELLAPTIDSALAQASAEAP